MPVDAIQINEIYRKYLGRDAEPEAIEYWAENDSLLDVENGVLGADEFRRNPLCFHLPNLQKNWKVCIIEKAKIIFVPIAKNAHTSLLDAFLKLNGVDWRKLPIEDELVRQHGDDDIKLHDAINKTGLLFKTNSPKYIEKVLMNDEWLRITVFREPIDRFISAFNHHFISERDNPISQRFIKVIFPDLELSSREENNIDQNLLLNRVIKYLLTSNSVIEDHFKRQTEYISDFKMDYIIPVERLDILQHLVASRSGQNLEISKMNVRSSKEFSLSEQQRAMLEDYYWLDRKLYEEAKENAEGMMRRIQ